MSGDSNRINGFYDSGNDNLVILSFGGNFPNTLSLFVKAEEKITKSLGVIIKKSTIYKTEPWGFKQSVNPFYNQVLSLSTNFYPEKILAIINEIEKVLGRKRYLEGDYKPRPIDIDILFYNNNIIEKDQLIIPHPLLHERNFILSPLSEIYPDLIHPIFQKKIKELLLQTSDSKMALKLNESSTMRYNFTVIEGNIGSGKTSLVKKMAKEFSTQIILEEFEENPFLGDFLESQNKNNLAVELQFLIDRFHQLNINSNSEQVISDYFIEKSLIFSTANLTTNEKKLFDSYFQVLFQKIKKPDLLVFLSVNTKRLLDNIQKRGRSYEQSISSTYLEKIHNAYINYFSSLENQKIVVIDTSQIDFVNEYSHYQKLTNIINSEHPIGITKLTL